MLKEIVNNIPFMGGQRIDHSWMYLRWMVRPYPDLNIFNNFSRKSLEIPLTSFVRNVAFCLGLCSTLEADWSDPERVNQERKQLTNFATDLFPEDPAIVDYPFYILGRWIRDENLNLCLLKSYLQFWQKIYDEIQRPPITFDVVSRDESTFEQSVRAELEKLQFLFTFQPYPFSLSEQTGASHYRPDFVLPRCRKKGKIVIFEPHGIWTPLQKRMVSLSGHSSFSIWVTPTKFEAEELMFVNRFRDFRKIYKNMYYLMLIVPSSVKERVQRNYPDIYDEIFEGKEIPKMLYDLKKNSE